MINFQESREFILTGDTDHVLKSSLLQWQQLEEAANHVVSSGCLERPIHSQVLAFLISASCCLSLIKP